jgi:hypothetical protein
MSATARLARLIEATKDDWRIPHVTVQVREPNDELIAILTGDDPVDWDRARELGAE